MNDIHPASAEGCHMKSPRTSRLPVKTSKAPTGISGFDQITGGGLPRGRTTLLVGGPGSGKTIFALQCLVHGAQDHKEPGIFVAFEESPQRIVANHENFGWNLAALKPKKLFFLDCQPTPDQFQSGNFDFSGLLAALGAKVKEMGAKRIVFDALDIMLVLLPDMTARRRETYRLHEWLLAQEITALITGKADAEDMISASGQSFGFMQFMVDCAVKLNQRVVHGVSQRNLGVLKYRGNNFNENEAPFVIGNTGFNVAMTTSLGHGDAPISNERVTSGVKRMDTMLGGGYYRGATVLINGLPGTAKTTLSGTFAEGACKRGERTLFVSFDSDGTEVVRELILSKNGVTLADICTAGGEVLMGTLRWEKESAEQVDNEVAEVEARLKQVRLDAEEAVLEVRAKSLQTELVAKQVEKTLLAQTKSSGEGEQTRGKIRIRELRGADLAKTVRK